MVRANCNKGAMIACQMDGLGSTSSSEVEEEKSGVSSKRAIKPAMNSANGWRVIELGFVLTKLKSRGHLKNKSRTLHVSTTIHEKGCRRRGALKREGATKNIYAIPSGSSSSGLRVLYSTSAYFGSSCVVVDEEYLLFIKPSGHLLTATHGRMKWRRQQMPHHLCSSWNKMHCLMGWHGTEDLSQ